MDNQNIKRTGFKLLEVIIIMIITVSLGVAIGVGIVFHNMKSTNMKDCDQYLVDSNIKEIIDTYEFIINKYYAEVDKEELANGAIKAMLEALGDPYSTYLDEEQTGAFDERMMGNYQGIGAEITQDKDGNILILKTFDNSPAQKAGLQPLDIILSVDDKSVEGLTTTQVASLLKGKGGTTVNVKVLRNEEEKTFTVTRDKIVIISIKQQSFERNKKKIGYIKIDIFSNNIYEQFREALLALEKEKIDSLIVDVRDNSGGFLTRVSEIISMFLPKDKIIYQLKERDGVKEVYSFTDESRSYPMAVLINQYSASASEILAVALKESYGATVVGGTSYGKGTVQETKKLATGGMIKYTIQEWLSPNGNKINEVGVKPDIAIEQNSAYYSEPSIENDVQLQKALEVLSQ